MIICLFKANKDVLKLKNCGINVTIEQSFKIEEVYIY